MPWEKPCVVLPNHQNAFLDALLIGAHAPVKMPYLTRASAFGSRFNWLLDALQMEPIYRRRDGFSTLSRNKEIFAQQWEKLRDGRSLLMFSEKEHALTYHLRPVTRGSSRFALRTQEAIDREVQLVPVGINDLRDDLTAAMKGCLLVPEKTDDYRERINRKNEDRPFPEMKRALETPETLAPKGDPRSALQTLAQWIDVLNAGPVWGTGRLYRWVDDPAFALSLKFAAAMFGLPVWWALLFAVGMALAGPAVGGTVVALAVATMATRLLVRWSNPPHPVE